jgi:hypothetical protein
VAHTSLLRQISRASEEANASTRVMRRDP